ncbi:MAG: helix-turn-helix domain-containing protein [Halorientalis sp.]
MTRTLHVHIGTTPDRSGLEDTLAAIDAGDEVDAHPSKLSVESLETFGRIFRPTNMRLLEAIVEHEPGSIRELARLVDRHPPEVTDNVNELTDYGLVELEQDGRAKRPVVWYDAIEIEGDVALTDAAVDQSSAAGD